ncbi:MAG TPA: hypothetical protein VD962_09845 [Rubricoccaceae bacterium]|nr:hypothetical protein [Rubricoccaceae bacterium]
MSFVVTGTQEGTFTPAPAGTHNAVCVDVVDLGIQMTGFGEKHRARFVWEIEERNPENGKPHLVFATMNVSLHENSSMGDLLRRWRGKDFTAKELEGFDIENVIGAPCLLTVEHNQKDGKTYANVASAVPLPKSMPRLEASGTYVREIDKDKSKDVRSKNYVGDTRAGDTRALAREAAEVHGGDGGGTPAYGDNFAANGDDLPF